MENKKENKFEFVLIIKNTISLKKLDVIIKAIRKDFEKIDYIDFLGLRNTAYPIKGENSGFYFIIKHQTPNEKITKIINKLKENTNILKYINIKLDF